MVMFEFEVQDSEVRAQEWKLFPIYAISPIDKTKSATSNNLTLALNNTF